MACETKGVRMTMVRQVEMYRETEMECYEENGEAEVEGVVQIIVIYNDGGRKNYPDGYDESRG